MSRTVVILAAGKGTRMQSITHGKNKCLVDVKDKTSIEHILGHFTKEDSILIVLNVNDDITESFLSSRIDLPVKWVYTDRQKGPGDSLYSVKELVPNGPFTIWYCDTIIDEPVDDKDGDWIICSDQNQECYKKYSVVKDGKLSTNNSMNEYSPSNIFYTGVSHISDAQKYWELHESNVDYFNRWADVAYMNMCKFDVIVTHEWYDVGNKESYLKAIEILRHK